MRDNFDTMIQFEERKSESILVLA
ncbi:hypothetical protein [Myxacorys almedinensis]